MRQRSRLDVGVRAARRSTFGGPLLGRARCIDALARKLERRRTVTWNPSAKPASSTVANAPLGSRFTSRSLPQLARDLRRAWLSSADAIDRLSQALAVPSGGGSSDRPCAGSRRRAVECDEAAAALVDVDGPQAVVDQELPAGGHVVDAEHQKVRSNDIHAFVSIGGRSWRLADASRGAL